MNNHKNLFNQFKNLLIQENLSFLQYQTLENFENNQLVKNYNNFF